MGKQVGGVPEAASLTDSSRGSIGVYLAGQRRLRGISLDDLSASTKIPRRSLERLEAGAFDGQVDGFARGFVRTVADALGLEAEDAVLRLLGEPDETAAAAGYGRARGLRALVVGALALAAASLALAALWWLHGAIRSDETSPQAPAVVYRHDAVRALAEAQSRSVPAPPAEPAAEPVESTGADTPQPGADPPIGGDR